MFSDCPFVSLSLVHQFKIFLRNRSLGFSDFLHETRGQQSSKTDGVGF